MEVVLLLDQVLRLDWVPLRYLWLEEHLPCPLEAEAALVVYMLRWPKLEWQCRRWCLWQAALHLELRLSPQSTSVELVWDWDPRRLRLPLECRRPSPCRGCPAWSWPLERQLLDLAVTAGGSRRPTTWQLSKDYS